MTRRARATQADMTRVRVSAETCTVLGHKAKATDPMWTGLDLPNADLLTQSTLGLAVFGAAAPPDQHLHVPWRHPDERPSPDGPPDDAYYRVRPRMKAGKKWKSKMVQSVAFERWSGVWWLAIRFAGKPS